MARIYLVKLAWLLVIGVLGSSLAEPVHFKQAAVKLGGLFQEWTDNILHASEIQEKIDEEVLLVNTIIDGADKLKMMAESLSHFFEITIAAVDKLKEKILLIYQDTNFMDIGNECCKLEDTHFDARLNDEIVDYPCFSRSAASNSMKMINTSELSMAMIENMQNYQSLGWQYYGTEEGITISYPGVKAEDCFSFDPRYRPWYVETATTPKDLVILLDRSMSMSSNDTFTLAKTAARTVINTLNPNDRISLVVFSNNVKTPSAMGLCYDEQMAFATPQVKHDFDSYLDELEITGSSNYSKALLKAFSLLETVQDEKDRNKGIMLLTNGNGITSDDQKIMSSQEDMYRKFHTVMLIYHFGSFGKEILEDMGANWGGLYEEIQNSEQLRSKLVHYYSRFTAKEFTSSTVTVPYTDFYNQYHIFSICHHIKYQGTLKGVTCADRFLDDLSKNFDLVQDDNVYAFIIDQTGRTLVHPLLPYPGPTPRSDPLFVNIKVLEPEAQNTGIIASMLQKIRIGDDEPGNKTIVKAMLSSSGDTQAGDFSTKSVTATYYWKLVKGTMFTVCLVMTNKTKTLMVNNQERHPKQFHYHASPLKQSCDHNGGSVTIEYATVSFGTEAFHTSSSINATRSYWDVVIENYMTGKGDYHPHALENDIRPTLALLEEYTNNWKESFESPLHQLYIRTNNSIMVTFPGKKLTRNTNNVDLIWYKKAHVTNSFIYMVRQDKILTLAQPIKKRDNHYNSTQIWGVVAMDFDASLLKHILEEAVVECSLTDKYSCIIMDEKANIIWHPKLGRKIYQTSALSIHKVEPDIGKYLIQTGILIRNQCTDYSWKKSYHTWRVSATVTPRDKLNSYPFFFFTPITGSNLFLIMKNSENATYVESCSSCNQPYKCNIQSLKCHCPCYDNLDYDMCSGEFIEDENHIHSVPSCVQQLKQHGTLSPQTSSPPQQHDAISCYPRMMHCSGLLEEWRCLLYAECKWCLDRSANTTSYTCTSVTQCRSAPAIDEDPQITGNCSDFPKLSCTVSILLSVLITMTLTLLVSCLASKFLSFSCMKQFCFSKVAVAASGDPYFYIRNLGRTRNQNRPPSDHTSGDNNGSLDVRQSVQEYTSTSQPTYMDVWTTLGEEVMV